jgi:hypothetical protein
LLYTIASILLTLCYIHVNKQSIKRWFFGSFHRTFYEYPNFSRWYGIRYERSDVWKTSRKESHVTGFDFPLLEYVGIKIRVGDIDFQYVKDLKQIISAKSDAVFNIGPYFKKGDTLSWNEFERILCNCFYDEIFRIFDHITPPKDKQKFIDAVLVLRSTVSIGGLYGKWLMLKNVGALIPLAQYFKSLDYADQMIALTPFMTVLDFAMFNIRDKAKTCSLKERFECLSTNFGIKYIPMLSNGEMVFCEVFVNGENNFANSMFGPSGVRCPGGVLTKLMVDGFMQFMNNSDYKVKKTVKNGREEVVLAF